MSWLLNFNNSPKKKEKKKKISTNAIAQENNPKSFRERIKNKNVRMQQNQRKRRETKKFNINAVNV